MVNRILTEDHTVGARTAVEFPKSWSDRDEVAPWDMADQFLSLRSKMPQQEMRGFQDAVFHYLQMTLEGTCPNLSARGWLRELEDPEGWKNG